LVVLLLFALFGACPARKSTVAEIISEVEALNELVVTHSKPHLGTRAEALERRRRSGGLTIYSPSGNADELSANLDAAEDDGKPDRWQQFKDFRKAMYDAVTSNKAKRAAIGVALFSVGVIFPPLEAAAALVAIGYGAWQLADKIQKKQKELGDDESLSATWVIQEVTITTALMTITFLTGGLADAVPDLFGFASEASKFLSESTHIAEAADVHFGENPQNINIGSVADIADIFRGLAEGKTPTGMEGAATSYRTIGTMSDVLAKDPLQVGEMVKAGTVTAVEPPTDGANNGFVMTGQKQGKTVI